MKKNKNHKLVFPQTEDKGYVLDPLKPIPDHLLHHLILGSKRQVVNVPAEIKEAMEVLPWEEKEFDVSQEPKPPSPLTMGCACYIECLIKKCNCNECLSERLKHL